MSKLTFPDGFIWGTATAAHQVEGNNTNSDWWEWENKPGSPCKEPSGVAIDHYRRYTRDIALLAGLGFNTYRFSVEWARIEPKEGFFDESEIAHYRKMIQVCAKGRIRPMVTLNHFTLPKWVADRGGWLSERTPVLFERFTRKVVQSLDTVDLWCTINEPGVVAMGGYLGALGFPPGTTGLDNWKWATRQLVEGHTRSLHAIKEIRPNARAGMTHAMQEWESNPGGKPVMDYARRMSEDVYLEASKDDDFIGVQTYTRQRIDLPMPIGVISRVALAVGPTEKLLIGQMVRQMAKQIEASKNGAVAAAIAPEPAPAPVVIPDAAEDAAAPAAPAVPAEPPMRMTQMGYEFRPQAVAATVRRVAQKLPGKPIIVTEHGLATDDDAERVEYIAKGLASLHPLIAEGVPLQGYIHWSAFDNFEWDRGYAMKFGLIGVDRGNLERETRPSARFLGDVARKNYLKTDN